MINYRRLQNTLSFDETIHQLTDVLTKTRRSSSLALLEKALAVADVDPEYRDKLCDALLKGSTREYRDVFELFGEYGQTYQEGVLGIFRPKTTKCSGGPAICGLQRGITFR